MVEQLPQSSIPQKIVWYGVGKALENLGPKAWEARAKTIIETRIIPAVSPVWQERWQRNLDVIAKTTGWVATAAEVGIVAGVTYGGYKGIRFLLDKRMQKPPLDTGALPKKVGEALEKPVSIRIKKMQESGRALTANEVVQKKLILEQLRVADAKKPGTIRRLLQYRRPHHPSWESKKRTSFMIRIRERLQYIRDVVEENSGDVLRVPEITRRERMTLQILRRVSESVVLPDQWRVHAMERENILTHRVRRRMHPARHTVDTDHIHNLIKDAPRRVAEVVERARNQRLARRLQEHKANQMVKIQRINETNAAASARILEVHARRAYEHWSASLGTSPVADVLRQAEVLVHNRGDETVRDLIARLTAPMPNNSMPQQVERSKVAAQLFSYIVDRRPDLQKQFGTGSAKDGAIAAKAADWVRKNLPGIAYLS